MTLNWLYKKFCQWRAWVNYCEADELGALFCDTQGYFRHIKIAKEWERKSK